MSIPDQLVMAINLQGEGNLDAAAQLFESVLAAEPGNAHALYSLSLLHMNATRPQEALELCQQGVAVAPAFAPLRYLHGVLLQNQGDKEGALKSYDAALALNPDYVEVLLNSGALLRSMFRHKEALARFNQILGIQPDHAAALGNCGIMLTEFKQSEQAIAMFQRLLKVKPDYDFGLGLLFYERMHICDWTDFDALSAQIVDGVRAGRRVCKSLAFMSASDQGRDHLLAARIFAQAYAPAKPEPLWRGETYHHDRVRLAYVSPDFREHPVGHLMAGVFERHDRSKFQTIAISLGMDDNSRLRARMLGAFDTFIDAHDMGSEQIARLMRDMEIDIAVDLGGYTSDTRTEVFAWRPAPVQVNYLGYPGTMGTRYFDYILADRHVIPPEHQDFYDEKVAYLPDAYLPTDNSVRISETTPTRSVCGLPDTGIVFCAFSHDYKICPPMFSVWMRLLAQVPGSVLWLASRSETTRNNLRREARDRGIDPMRLVFAGRVPLVEDHLARYRQADIFLDTYPYNAHTTAADALMAGLPVVTCRGHAFPARVAASLLHAVGLPELVTDSLAEYESLALALASKPESVSAIKARLRLQQHTHALFDTERFCHNLEHSLLSMTQAATPAPPPMSAAAPATAPGGAVPALDVAAQLIQEGNIPQAELQLRLYQRSGRNCPRAVRLLAQVTHSYGLPPRFRLSEKKPAAVDAARYLFIRDWGYGFWSNVHHVLGQLLVAELTHRVPVVWWGDNSLFRDAANPNAFALFFEPVAPATLAPPPLTDLSIFPPKWNATNLQGAAINAWEGPYSRMAAPYLFDRPEDMVVSDFYAPLSAILPWIGPDSAYHGLDEDEIHLRLCEKYLTPTPAIRQKADDFFAHHMAGRAWVAVHVRGSDKIHESPHLHQTNARYTEFIDQIIALNPDIGVFLLTDAVDVHEAYQARYGTRLVTTPALRTGSQVGVHLQGHSGYAIGADVLIDVLLAIRCQYFLGNKESNVSLAVSSLKRWPAGFIFMFGDKSVRSDNWFLHHGHNRPPEEREHTGETRHADTRVTVQFYNDWHNGDVHMSRPYVMALMRLLGDCDYYYCHRNNPKLLADVDRLTSIRQKMDADISINTWLGQFQYQGMTLDEMAAKESVEFGANFPCYHAVMRRVFESLELGDAIGPTEDYVPTINYQRFDIANIDRYFAQTSDRHVLVCNNQPMSGQAPDVAFPDLVGVLADRFPRVRFLISNKDGRKPERSNVLYCSDIIDNPATTSDLNEISYISTHCDLIFGRSSGPYSFSVTRDNLRDKQFVCICNARRDTWFLENSSNIAWTNNPSTDHLIRMLSPSIEKLSRD